MAGSCGNGSEIWCFVKVRKSAFDTYRSITRPTGSTEPVSTTVKYSEALDENYRILP